MGLFKKKPKQLTPEEKIEAASTKVNGAFIMFQQAHDALVEAEKELERVVSETERNMDSLRAQLSEQDHIRRKAMNDINTYKKLDSKIAEFTAQEDDTQ